MKLSVILPAYNECNRLGRCVDRVSEYLSKTPGPYEIIIVEDGSTDGSYEVAEKVATTHKCVTVIHNHDRAGRGASISRAIRTSDGERIIYMDVDLATDIRFIGPLIEHLENGASIVTGSRLAKGAQVSRPISREVASRAYNLFVRILFGSKIYDHQCGFKAFNRKDVLCLIDRLENDHWFWDTELLVTAQSEGYRVDELPVEWEHNGGNDLNMSKVNVVKDSFYMGKRLMKLKWRLMGKN